MKKELLFSILMLICFVLAITSCNVIFGNTDNSSNNTQISGDTDFNNGSSNDGDFFNPVEHKHYYQKVITIPTCTKSGYTTYTCQCGDTYNSDYVDADGHNFRGIITYPSCTEKGYTTYICTVCKEEYIDKFVDKIDHNYKETVINPTCENDGYTIYNCSTCDSNYITDIVDPLGHSPGAEATCTSPQLCTVCEKTLVSKLQHDLGDWDPVIVATCTQKGENQRHCKHCSYYESQVVPTTTHNFENKICQGCGVPYFSEGLVYELSQDGNSYSVAGFGECTDLHIIIPNEYEGLPVTTIADKAFLNCNEFLSVYFPDNVTSIGTWSFMNCSKLTYVEFSDNLHTIGVRAFDGCTGLTNIDFANVKIIDTGAFLNCTNITYIDIPDSVEKIGQMAFKNCTSLHTINLPFIGESLNATGHQAHFGYIFGYDTSGDTTAHYVDYKNNRKYTFAIPDSLITVNIRNIISIPDFAFQNCNNILFIHLPEELISIGESSFEGCSEISYITIPKTVTNIGYSAFDGCYKLTSVTIPHGVTSIGYYAFAGCINLTEVFIPSTVTSNLALVFCNSYKLTDVYYEGTEEQWKGLLKGMASDDDPLLSLNSTVTVHCNYNYT